MKKSKPEKDKTLTDGIPNPDEADLQTTDDKEFAARYHSAKEREVEKLTKEIEEKQSVSTKAKKRNKWIKNILLLVLIGASIGIMFLITGELGDTSVTIGEMFRGVNWLWFGLFVGLILILMLLGALKYAYLLKISTGKFHLGISTKTMFLGKYYDGITPLGTGGQPFQIYYLHKRKIPAGIATATPLVRYIVETIVFCLVAFGLLLASHFVLSLSGATRTVTFVVAWISLAFNFIVPIIIVLASVAPKLGKRLIVKIVTLLNKIRIVKHKYPTMKKYVYEMQEYSNSMKVLIIKWWKLLPLILINLLDTLAYVSIPFFAVITVANVPPTAELYLQMCCMSMISFYVASLVPTPGNSGANESATTLIFLQIAASFGFAAVSGWVVLFWRFATYYLYILIGIFLNVTDMIRGAIKSKRESKNLTDGE